MDQTMYQQLLALGMQESELDNHCSDLYVLKNAISTKFVNEYEFKMNVTTFRSELEDRQIWYEIPFAYVEYHKEKITPYFPKGKLTEEGKELYFHTKNVFIDELEKVSPDSVSVIIVVRQIVKKAIDKYILDYCSGGTNPENIFSGEDFQGVSWKIHDEIMNGGL